MLVADGLSGVECPLVGLHGQTAQRQRLVRELGKRLPGVQVVEIPSDASSRHLLLTARGRFDAIIDRGGANGNPAALRRRKRRFMATFYHLRPGGLYVVPGGAVELGERSGPLGALLRLAREETDEPLRSRQRDVPTNTRVAIRQHVTSTPVDRHLVLRHDLPDVVAKIRDDDFNDYLEEVGQAHRVLDVIPAGEPPAPALGAELPEPRRPPMQRPIDTATISLRLYDESLVAPRQLVFGDGFMYPDTFRHNQWPILRADMLVDVAELFAVPMIDLPAEPQRLEGTYLHLDNEFRGHFGHLLTETLSRVWSWPKALELDPGAKVLVGANAKRPTPQEYEYLFYEACGIPRDRVVVFDRPVVVERLVSGTPMLSHPQYVHPRITEWWDLVGDRLEAMAEQRDRARRIFVGRRMATRSCVNGAEVEALFVERGFEVVYPEDHSLPEQVALFRGADAVGGFAGSAMFQILFAAAPKHVIAVTVESYRARNEYLIAAARGHRLDVIVCRAEPRSIQASFRFDPEREGPALRQVLDSLP